MFAKTCPACGESIPLRHIFIGRRRMINCNGCGVPLQLHRFLGRLISIPAAAGVVVLGAQLWSVADILSVHLGRNAGNAAFRIVWASTALVVQLALYWLLLNVSVAPSGTTPKPNYGQAGCASSSVMPLAAVQSASLRAASAPGATPAAAVLHPRRFIYRAPLWNMALTSMLVGLSCLGAAAKASITHRALIINGIYLTAAQASRFWWGLSVVMGVGLLIALLVTLGAARAAGYVELGQEVARLPRAALSQKLCEVPYNAIKQVVRKQVPGREILFVYADSSKYSVASTGFNAPSDYRAFVQSLRERMANVNSSRHIAGALG